MEFRYRAVLAGTQQDSEPRVVAEARTVHACVGTGLRLKKIPAELRQKLLTCGEFERSWRRKVSIGPIMAAA